MSTQAAAQHKQAAEQYGHSACHDQEAAEHHKVGHDEKAKHHAQIARGHHAQAMDHASAASKSHAEHYGKQENFLLKRRCVSAYA